MTNRDLAEKIYEDLNKRGADLGNASIGIIRKTLDDNGVKNCSIPVVVKSFCDCEEEPSCRMQDNTYYCNSCDKEVK